MYQRSNAIKIQYDDNDTDDNEYNYILKIRNIEFDLELACVMTCYWKDKLSKLSIELM